MNRKKNWKIYFVPLGRKNFLGLLIIANFAMHMGDNFKKKAWSSSPPKHFSRSPHLYPQPTLLQRLSLDLDTNFLQFQHYVRYQEPLELTTASPLDLSLKTSQVPITPPCTPSPKIKSPTPEVPSKKAKVI